MIDVDLRGHTALVTGSARGLGRELVLALAECGADVVVHYRSSEEAAESLADRVRELEDVSAMTVQADVTDPAAVDRAFDDIEDTLGQVDLLVNNVGQFSPRHWMELDVETWQTVMETNLLATYLCCRRVLPGMFETGYGRIVNIGYAGADRALVHPKNAPYFIAKTGVTMFTRMLAADTQDVDINANVVAPYVIENSETFPDDLPRDRPAHFSEVVQVVLFFLAPESRYVSGQHLAVDGGWLPERV